METKKSHFNRNLLIILSTMCFLTVAAMSIATWVTSEGSTPVMMVVLNGLILLIPLGLLFGSIYLLAVSWREHRFHGELSPRLSRVIRWAPRIASILIILFLGLFSFDVFSSNAGFWQMVGGFFIHNLPGILLLILLIIAWKFPVVGFVSFLIYGVVFAIFFTRSFALSNLLFFVFPILLIALLFYADWQWNKKLVPPPDPDQE